MSIEGNIAMGEKLQRERNNLRSQFWIYPPVINEVPCTDKSHPGTDE